MTVLRTWLIPLIKTYCYKGNCFFSKLSSLTVWAPGKYRCTICTWGENLKYKFSTSAKLLALRRIYLFHIHPLGHEVQPISSIPKRKFKLCFETYTIPNVLKHPTINHLESLNLGLCNHTALPV